MAAVKVNAAEINLAEKIQQEEREQYLLRKDKVLTMTQFCCPKEVSSEQRVHYQKTTSQQFQLINQMITFLKHVCQYEAWLNESKRSDKEKKRKNESVMRKFKAKEELKKRKLGHEKVKGKKRKHGSKSHKRNDDFKNTCYVHMIS
ncbi:hypothetical protein Tco_0928310 [Tanacetum coccineum]